MIEYKNLIYLQIEKAPSYEGATIIEEDVILWLFQYSSTYMDATIELVSMKENLFQYSSSYKDATRYL